METKVVFNPVPGWKRLAACAVLALAAGWPAFGGELRAGFARLDITPTEPVRMAGYAGRQALSAGVHDPLSARVAAFEEDGHRLVLVSIDNLGFYNDTSDPLRDAILQSCGLRPAELFLCATHAHSAPSLGLDPGQVPPVNIEYTKTLQHKLVEVVHTALGRMAPAQIGIGSGVSPIAINRRQTVQDENGKSKVVLGRNPSVLTDREVQVLKVGHAGQEQPVAVMFAYAVHSTALGPKNLLVSGDIHGLAQQFLENYYGNGVVAPGFAGASGNVNPWVSIVPDFRTTNGWIPEPVLLGTLLAEEVARVAEGIHPGLTNTVLRTAIAIAALPAKDALDGGVTNGPTQPFRITVGRVGDIAVVGWGGEVFNETGQAIKAASPFSRTFILTHCNGAAGYLPTRTSYLEGGYEVQISPFGPAATDTLFRETLQMLRKLKSLTD